MAAKRTVGWKPPRPVEGTVFHYTSAAGLLGILSSRTLWASEVAGLNDVAEVTGGLDVAERWLRAREPSSLGDAFLDMVARLRDGHLGGAADVFVLSASLDGDDANQWRVYGNGGFGYSIELDSSAPLSVVVEPESLESRPRQEAGTYNLDADDATTSEWVRVAYSDGEHHHVMDSLFAWAAGTVPSNRRSADLENLLEGLVLVFGIGYGLESAVRLIKGAGFSGEREARIFTMASFGGGRTVGFTQAPLAWFAISNSPTTLGTHPAASWHATGTRRRSKPAPSPSSRSRSGLDSISPQEEAPSWLYSSEQGTSRSRSNCALHA
ncbi:MAG: hypothetical protein KQH57_20860 [Actinomycetales bacterium]|nr:hypothetical protein [Actinomycetales bacterium]